MALTESEALSLAIERLYDASVDPSRWSEALSKATEFVGGFSANLSWQDAANNNAMTLHSWNCDEDYLQLYFEKYANLNPYFPALAFVEIGKVVSGADIIPHEEFRETRFYLEWVKPQGLIDVIGVNLERTAASTAFFTIHRSEDNGIVDGDMRRRCALIAPHVRRAVAIGKVVQTAKSTEVMLKAALDRVAAAVVFVTGNGKIVFANQVADEFFRDKQVLISRRGVAGAVDAAADRLLREAFAAAERGDAALGLKGIDIPLTSPEGHHYVANVLSVASDTRRMSDMGSAVAALFVRRITLASQSPLEVAGRRYQLTPSELRVLAAVLEAGSVDNIAKRLGVSKSTVKTHLNHVLAKTGARRQTDLFRLVVGGNA